jgi:hypothetical protein
MRPYYVVSGILLIPPIIDFAVAAPVLAQEKPRASVDGVYIPEDATTILKRVDDWSELWADYLKFDHAKAAKAEESSAAGPSSSSQSPSSPPLGPADGSAGIDQPPPSIAEEPSPVPVPSPDHALPSKESSRNMPDDLETPLGLLGLAPLSENELIRLLDLVL